MQNIEQSLTDLDRLITILNQSSEISIKQLIEAEKKLQEVESLWRESEKHSKAIELLVEKYKQELTQLRLLYEKSEVQNKQLRKENSVLKGALIISLIAIAVEEFTKKR